MSAGRTAVVHLVRRANGLEPFDAFMTSYEAHAGGLEHDLVLLLKGFDHPADAGRYLERAAGSAPSAVHVPDMGFDLGAYLAAAQALDHDRLCLLNSFSAVQAPGWLDILHRALEDRAVGAAGATGSWGSHVSYSRYQLGLGGPYDGVFGPRQEARRAFHELSGATPPGAVLHWLATLRHVVPDLTRMPAFPAPHLRTNAFLIDRMVLTGVRAGRLATKRDAHHLESGRHSLTAQLRARGRPPVVVDATGAVRRPEEWHTADVFWQDRQEGLLVADNQTRLYRDADAGQRRVLAAFAWGARARPR